MPYSLYVNLKKSYQTVFEKLSFRNGHSQNGGGGGGLRCVPISKKRDSKVRVR